MRTRRAPVVSAVVGLTVLIGFAPAPTATGASELAGPADPQQWKGAAEAVPVSFFLEAPVDLRASVPFARASLEFSPLRSQAAAGLGATAGLEAAAARAANPGAVTRTTAEPTPLGPAGPHAVADCPSPTEARSTVTTAIEQGDVALASLGVASASMAYATNQVLTGEAVSHLHDVQLGNTTVRAFSSRLGLELRLGQEPLVSYRLSLAGVEVNGQALAGAGDAGITLSGEQVAARDLFEQFNREAARYGALLGSERSSASISLVEPRVERHPGGEVTASAPAVRAHGRSGTAPAGLGDLVTVTLGYAEIHGFLAGGVQPSAPGGPALPPVPVPLQPVPSVGPVADPARDDGSGLLDETSEGSDEVVVGGERLSRETGGVTAPVPGGLDAPAEPGAVAVAVPAELPPGSPFARDGRRHRPDESARATSSFPPRTLHNGFLAAVSVAMALMVLRNGLALRRTSRRHPGNS